MSGAATVFRRNQDAVFRVIDGEAVVVEPRKGLVSVLNEVGCRIWELADGTATAGAIAQTIADEFDVAVQTALADTIAFLDDLRDKGLVDASAAHGPDLRAKT